MPALRAPVAAVPAFLALGCGLSSLSAIQILVTLRGVGPGSLGWGTVVGWWAASLVAFSSTFLALPVWAWLRPRLAGVSSSRAWVAYCALFYLVACGGGLLRKLAAAAWLPELHDQGHSWVFVFNAGLTGSICALMAEIPAEFLRRHRAASGRRRALAAELDGARARLVHADDHARRELAEVLHGRLQSQLVAALAKVEQARQLKDLAGAGRLLAEASRYVEEVRGEALRQVDELAAHTPGSLVEAVEDLLTRFSGVLPLGCTWQPGARELKLAPEVARPSYRLLDEALLNAYRHARATQVTLEVAVAPTGHLLATVRDNGLGFEPSRVPQGLGLAGLGPALERLGGRFELRSRPGEGTTVLLELPTTASL